MTGTIINFAERLSAANEHSRAESSKAERPAKRGRYNADQCPEGDSMKPAKQRWWLFSRAELYLQFVKAQSDVAFTGSTLFDRYTLPECAAYEVVDRATLHFSWMDKIHADEIALLLTPASRRTELDLKRRILAGSGTRFEHDRSAIDRVMAADESYLAIPRQHRNAALSGKAVRS